MSTFWEGGGGGGGLAVGDGVGGGDIAVGVEGDLSGEGGVPQSATRPRTLKGRLEACEEAVRTTGAAKHLSKSGSLC